jgi:hypothetical protein
LPGATQASSRPITETCCGPQGPATPRRSKRESGGTPPRGCNTSASGPARSKTRRHDLLSRTLNCTPDDLPTPDPASTPCGRPKRASLQGLSWARVVSNHRPLACEALPQSRLEGLMFLQTVRLWRRIAGRRFRPICGVFGCVWHLERPRGAIESRAFGCRQDRWRDLRHRLEFVG